jgi:hypothetical protein
MAKKRPLTLYRLQGLDRSAPFKRKEPRSPQGGGVGLLANGD